MSVWVSVLLSKVAHCREQMDVMDRHKVLLFMAIEAKWIDVKELAIQVEWSPCLPATHY